METKFDKVKEFFEKPNYLLNVVNIEIRRAIIDDLISTIHGKHIIDIGCGDGSLSLRFSKCNKVVMLDGAKQMIDAAKKNIINKGNINNVTFIQADILRYEVEHKFDLVLCIGVVSHIDDVDKIFDKISFLMKHDGKAIIQFSNVDHFRYQQKKSTREPDAYGYSLNKLNKHKFYQLAENAGLAVKKSMGYCWQFPILDRFSPPIQIGLLNALRKRRIFHFLNSEWLVLFEKPTNKY